MGDHRDDREEPIVPYNHSTVGAVATRAGGTAGGAVKGGFETVGKVILGLAVAGALIFVLGHFGVFEAISGVVEAAGKAAATALASNPQAVTAVANFNPLPLIGGIALWGGVGALVGVLISPLTGLFGTVKGGFDGYEKADTRISQERGAAQVMNAEIQALQAQAMMAQAAQPRPGDRYANASTLLQADHSALQAAQLDGRMSGLQLEAARG